MDGSGTEYYSHIVQNQPIITYFKQMSKDISNSIKFTRNNTKFRLGQRAYFMDRLKLRLQTDHNRRKRIVSSNMFKSLQTSVEGKISSHIVEFPFSHEVQPGRGV